MYVVPADGRLIRDPNTFERVPDTGREVPRTVYWLRALKRGDVIEGDPDDVNGAETSES